MPRRLRFASGGYVYHVLNRTVGRARIFAKVRDYQAFEEVLVEAKKRAPMRVLAWCALPNHTLCEAQHNQCVRIRHRARIRRGDRARASKSASLRNNGNPTTLRFKTW